MTHVARQADAAGHTAKADGDLEQLRLLCYDLAGFHTVWKASVRDSGQLQTGARFLEWQPDGVLCKMKGPAACYS